MTSTKKPQVELPKVCPICGCEHTKERYPGYPNIRECIECKTFWYYKSTTKKDIIEVVGGEKRRYSESAYDAMDDGEYFG